MLLPRRERHESVVCRWKGSEVRPRPSRTHLVRMRVRILFCLLLLACSSSRAEPERRQAEPVERQEAPRAQPRAERIATALLGALAANDVEQLEPLFDRGGWTELEQVTRESFRRLHRRFADEGIDPAKAKIERVESTGQTVEMVDVVLAANGRRYRTHFSASTLSGYHLLGIANWLKRD